MSFVPFDICHLSVVADFDVGKKSTSVSRSKVQTLGGRSLGDGETGL
jgi:hypothetical protein